MRFEDVALSWILHAEGGFVDHPSDPGGATKLGVSLRAVQLRDFDRDGKLDFDLDGDGDVDASDIRLIEPRHAARLYREDYWSLAGAKVAGLTCGDLPVGVDLALFDAAVRMGPRRAVALLQRSLGMKVDGTLGTITVGVLLRAVADGRDVVSRFCAVQLEWLATRPGWRTFGHGWAFRLLDLVVHITLERWAPEIAERRAARWPRI